ncbi:MAG: phosphoribosylformylglycinamidine synthase subunit PurS [Bacillota bacterium]
MLRARICVTLRAGVLDPQGETIASSLNRLGFDEVTGVRAGKYLELTVDGDDPEVARSRVDEMCRRLLANPVIEDYSIEIEEDRS